MSVLVYGASGYTAGLVIPALVRGGMKPILAARNPGALRALGERLGLPTRLASLDDRGGFVAALDGVRVVLNLAGPFANTAQVAARTCIDAGVHYLDVSGEVDAICSVAALHAQARERGVMLMSGVGFDVVPSDCLCAHVARALPDLHSLRLAVSGLQLMSPGSLRTLAAELSRPTRVRQGGELREVSGLVRDFDFGAGPRACAAVSWGDLATAALSTGARDVETFFEVTPALSAVLEAKKQFGWMYRLPWVVEVLQRQLPRFIDGPTAEQRVARHACIVVEAEGPAGRRAVARLVTPEAYTFTAESASFIVQQVLLGNFEAGFQTPSRIFGGDFILGFAGVTRVDAKVSLGG